MRKDFALLVAVTVLLALPTSVAAGKKAESVACGVAYSVDGAGSLLLQNHGKFSVIELGSDTVIQDSHGRSVALAEIRRGDWIEYRSEPDGRKIFVNSSDSTSCSKPQIFGKNG
jgi:hypothetical protein